MTGDPGKTLPEAGGNASTRKAHVRGVLSGLRPLWIGLLVAGLAGAALVIASEFATFRTVKVLTASCDDLAAPSLRGLCATSGHEQHSYALALIGVVAVVMAWGATIGRSRPAAAALALLGAAVLAIALGIDAPATDKTGVLGLRFESAHAQAGPGLWMEIAGGALAFVTGFVALAALPRSRSPRRDRKRRRRREERQGAQA
jgi:drug/metabolite transporter (DMT)-like permease